jgi:hypothetical protein
VVWTTPAHAAGTDVAAEPPGILPHVELVARLQTTIGWTSNSSTPTIEGGPMRKAGLTVLACAAVLWTRPAHAAGTDDATPHRYAADTWASFVAMTDPASGLPTDQLHADGRRDVQTSTTNIGAYMWSAVAAERLGILPHAELVARLQTTIGTLEHMERHEPDGQFYNWYDHRTGAKMTTDEAGNPRAPILSSVDNAWLATGLRVVANTVPEVGARARAIYDGMDFGFYYVPAQNRILFHFDPAAGTGPCCYDTLVSESRIADYIGIAKGELPRREYYGRWRTFPATCDFASLETRPDGFDRTYDGVSVFDGSYPYGPTRLTPSWGGSMFEALMPALFVPEQRWGGGSWRQNHPLPSTPRSTMGSTSRATARGASPRPTSPRAATPPTGSTRSA